MNYIGEHLLPGQLGQFLVVLSFVASLIATIAYYKSGQAAVPAEADSWKKLGRIAFITDAASIFAIFGIILYIIANHYFEYFYAYNHSDVSLHPEYLLSSIWEGQEGSFLLWACWHGVLGLVLIRTAKKWEAPVMMVISFAQVCLATMVLGVYLFDLKIGNTPFLLTRYQFQDAPIFNRPDYLSLSSMQDGRGLNQLLQNYWMVIHPPITFLGFASTIVPFAYAIAGLWKKDYGSWTKAAMPWSLFSGGILGLGIMMGAKWAYESLTFGGYWAWDPVENASLVAWLVLVAGIHTQLVYNATGHSLRPTYFFLIGSFLLILYSTYLTRSGDLQDTSVHAFTGSGMNWQLRIFVAVFTLPSLFLFFRHYKKIPNIQKEENTYSREFWMFIGSLVIFLSAAFIIAATSLPVINKVFGTEFTVGEDVKFSYNRIQIFVAIVLGMLTAVTQYLKYKDTARRYFGKKILLPTIIAILVSAAISIFGNIDYDKYGIGFLMAIHLAIFTSVYALVANAAYIGIGLKGKMKAAGGAVAHIGFAMLLLGALISSAKLEVLSMNFVNPLNFGPEQPKEGMENMTLYRGVKMDMGKYWVTYSRDTTAEAGKKLYFQIDLERKDGKESFSLYPDLIRNTKGQEGYSNNPDSRHYLHKDIFSYISYADKMSEKKDTSEYRHRELMIGDTVFYSAGYMRLDSVTVNPNNERYQFRSTDTALMANLSGVTNDNRRFAAHPVFYLEDNQPKYLVDTVFSQGLAIVVGPGDKERHLSIGVKESSDLAPFIALKVLQFPFINLVWLGTVIMIIGFTMGMFRRLKGVKA
ncbi:MAG: cytochrome c biogenesis protein CcsA [Candidatus Pseudobacter hemicellulosilyticus]|uniref:Cytochrome c biogenesis protein CcsA n=1 Tax=Candidatus Pseudobacter hemicellulosilyticus TaxID=3121375 RepID=A0AAJ6BG05_9BACT|nr:MAG: cytochrome c biogenesis protein CcsA [Pseudobacter sp.]